MSAKFFLDTNIVVYTFDSDAPKKETSRTRINRASLANPGRNGEYSSGAGVFECGGEQIYSSPKFSDAQQYLHDVLKPLCTVFPSIDLFRQALVIQQDLAIRFMIR